MKSITGKYVGAFSMFFLLVACAPMTTLSTVQNNAHNHTALAKHYESLAQEMQTKVQEQKEILKNKPRTSYFGENGQHIKKRIARKIRKYEKAAEINLAKAAYHKKIAQEQAKQEMLAEPGETKGQIDKAKLKSNSPPSTEESSSDKKSL